MPLILASGSPRRRELLENAAVTLASIRSPDIVEQRSEEESLWCIAADWQRKSKAVSEAGHWVLAADTIVVQGNQVFEKQRRSPCPRNAVDFG